MDRIAGERTSKQENSLTVVLRTLIKQKEDTAQRYKTENLQLQELLMKQQDLLNELNEDNMKLHKNYNELRCSYSKMQNQQQQSNNDHHTECVILNEAASEKELLEQCVSLKEQLLVSQNYGAHMLKELKETKRRMKGMSRIVRNFETSCTQNEIKKSSYSYYSKDSEK
jgi:hypothetical protein